MLKGDTDFNIPVKPEEKEGRILVQEGKEKAENPGQGKDQLTVKVTRSGRTVKFPKKF